MPLSHLCHGTVQYATTTPAVHYYPGIRQPQDTSLHPHLSTRRQLTTFIRLTTEQTSRSSHFYGCPKSPF